MSQWLFDSVSALLVVLVGVGGIVDAYLGDEGRKKLRHVWLVNLWIKLEQVTWRTFARQEAVTFARVVSVLRHYPRIHRVALTLVLRWVFLSLALGLIGAHLWANPVEWLYPNTPEVSITRGLASLLGFRGMQALSLYWDLCGYTAASILLAVELTAVSTMLAAKVVRRLSPSAAPIEALLFSFLIVAQILAGLYLGQAIFGFLEEVWKILIGVVIAALGGVPLSLKFVIAYMDATVENAVTSARNAINAGGIGAAYDHALWHHAWRQRVSIVEVEDGLAVFIYRLDFVRVRSRDIEDAIAAWAMGQSAVLFPIVIRLGFALGFVASTIARPVQRIIKNTVQDLSNTASPVMALSFAAAFVVKLLQGLGKAIG